MTQAILVTLHKAISLCEQASQLLFCLRWGGDLTLDKSENNSYSYEWPFLKDEDSFRTWMSVLGQEGRDFSAPLSFVESECGVLWREDKVH